MEQIAYKKETDEDKKEFLYGKGCRFCANTGYHGRTGLFEIMRLSDRMRAMLLDKAEGTSRLREQAISEGMISLAVDGMLKVKAGTTNPAEVLRNAYTTE
jgi:general secretion pathway protein E